MSGRIKKISVLVRSDPRTSGRPTEAIRLALGLASGGHDVDLILADSAPWILRPAAETGIDDEAVLQYLETLKAYIPHIFIDIESLGSRLRRQLDTPSDAERQIGTLPLTKAALTKRLGAAECFFCL